MRDDDVAIPQVQYGRWLIEGYPKVLLFDIGSAWGRLSEWRGDLGRLLGINLPAEDRETNDAIVFGYLVAWFFGTVRAPPRRMWYFSRALCSTFP